MAIAPIPLIDLDDEDDEEDKEDKCMNWTMAWKNEVTEDLDPGMAWAMADYAKINSESKAKSKGKTNNNAPKEVEAKGKAESVEVSDYEDE